MHLAAISLPSEYVLEPIDKIRKGVPPFILPNEGVSLQISVSGDTDRRDDLTDRLTEQFTEQLSANKIDVRDGERHVLSVSYAVITNGRDQYRFKRDDSELIVENRLLQASITLSRGSSRWQRNVTVDLASVDYVLDSDSDDPAGDLLKQQEKRMFDLLRLLSPPVSLPPVDRNTFGRSRCDISGEQVSVGIDYRF